MDKPQKTEQETIALIEAGLEDIRKNKATKKEVLDLIEERRKIDQEVLLGETRKAAQAEVGQFKSQSDELKATVIELQKKLNQLRANGYQALKAADGSYKGMFANHMEAKAFGLMIMAAATATKPACKDRHDAVIKALDGMGIQPTWLDAKDTKIMTGSSQAGGSALVTVEMIPTLIQMFEQYGVFEGNAQPVPMGAGQTLQPRLDTLLPLQCPGEGKVTTAADFDIALISHLAKTLTALTAYSIELEEDSAIELGELLASLFVRSYGYGIDKLAFLGDGTGTYFGFKGIVAALLAVSATIGSIKSLVVGTDNVYSGLLIGDFNSVCGILPDYADDGNAKWYVHRYFYYTVMVAKALAATGTTATEVLMGAGQRQKQFLSYPVQFTQVMPRTEGNSQICALLANLRLGAQLGRRGVMQIFQSAERFFEMRLIGVLAARRLSINIHGVGDTTNAGPICGLITAAS